MGEHAVLHDAERHRRCGTLKLECGGLAGGAFRDGHRQRHHLRHPRPGHLWHLYRDGYCYRYRCLPQLLPDHQPPLHPYRRLLGQLSYHLLLHHRLRFQRRNRPRSYAGPDKCIGRWRARGHPYRRSISIIYLSAVRKPSGDGRSNGTGPELQYQVLGHRVKYKDGDRHRQLRLFQLCAGGIYPDEQRPVRSCTAAGHRLLCCGQQFQQHHARHR